MLVDISSWPMAGQEAVLDYAAPPPTPDGTPFWVDARIDLVRCSAVDTVKSTAHIQIYVITYWTDSRLAGWTGDLPPQLWGPHLTLQNASADNDLQDSHAVFDFADRKAGRLKRVRLVCGTVENAMNLTDFPFDMDDIAVQLTTTSTWLALDESKSGEIPRGQIYRLRPVNEDGSEGHYLHLWWDGYIQEWNLHGVSTRIFEHPPAAAGYTTTEFTVAFHVSRKTMYYFWKVLFPLYMVVMLSHNTFQFETDELSNRNSSIQTCILAAFAMLYVVGGSLPKTDFLTKIDVIIVVSTMYLGIIGGMCRLLSHVHSVQGADVASAWNTYVEISLIVLYLVANAVIFMPPFYRKARGSQKLANLSMVKPLMSSGTDESTSRSSLEMPPTVKAGFTYIPLQSIQAK